jgi:SAM-dependent methyltransferase
MSGASYERDRWEFGVVARSVGAGDSVLDIGCGEGAFLRQVAPRVRRAAGFDHNQTAVRRLRQTGIEAYAEDAESFAAREQGAFDVVTAFHTLEHLEDVGVAMEPAVACTKADGRIFISVPNRERYGSSDFEALDCPPHHLSRWQPDQFRTLAQRFDLTLVSIAFEEPDSSHADMWRIDRARTAGHRLAGDRGGDVLARAYTKMFLSRPTLPKKRYRRAAARKGFTARGVYGMTMVAELRKPS